MIFLTYEVMARELSKYNQPNDKFSDSASPRAVLCPRDRTPHISVPNRNRPDRPRQGCAVVPGARAPCRDAGKWCRVAVRRGHPCRCANVRLLTGL